MNFEQVYTLESETNERLNRLEKALVDFKIETRQRFDQIDSRLKQIDSRFEQIDNRFEQMQTFNQQTQDLVRAIYFAIKQEKPPE